MAVPATVDEFIDMVRKSGVADEKRLDALLREKRSIPSDPKKAADFLIQNAVITYFQSENILLGKWKRFTIGKYRILEKLGSGGFASVYLCEHKLMRRRVAVKVLPVAKTKGSSALDRFYREARASATLDHPNIVHAYDIDQDGDLHFLVMEYVDGPNLQEIVKRTGRLEVGRACNYMSQAALALQHAYEQGMVHRDIKPSNFLVDRSGVVKLLDLGLALKSEGENSQLTKMHEDGALGTADYIAPEQAVDSHDVDVRADIYSLGVTFYFLLTGRAPFEGLPIADKLLAHHMKAPPPIADYRKDVPAGVVTIINKMMMKSVAHRYATPGEIVDALAPFAPVELSPPADAEMPVISPAAMSEPAPGQPAAGSGWSRTTPVPTPPASRTATPPAPAPAPPPVPSRPAAIMAPTLVKAPPAPERAPWEDVAADTDNPLASGETVPHPGTSTRQASSSRKSMLFVIILVLGFIVLPLCLTSLIFSALFFITRDTVEKRPEVAPLRLEVSKDPSRRKAFPTIQNALKFAETDTVIELWDERYEENVVLDGNKNIRTSITLQAAPGKIIEWRSARNDPDTPLLRLIKASDFKFKGDGIMLDGSLDKDRNVNDLIMITSNCSGMVIENLQMRHFARNAVLVMNAVGAANHPIRLERLHTFTQEFEKPRAAIYFDANPKMIPVLNEHIEIRDSVFRGIEPMDAIQFNKNLEVLGDNVRWPGK